MPTLRGWALTGAGLALFLLWLFFGESELLLAGSFLVLASALALLYVRIARPQLAIARHLSASTVHDGDSASVSVILFNSGTRSVSNVHIEDEVVGLGSALFGMARLRPGQKASASYRVTCRPRGVYAVGPTRAHTSDPLGLAEFELEPGPLDRVVVFPAIEELSELPVSGGRDPDHQVVVPDRSHQRGDEFFSLREFQSGDDLRRIHWPYSAKTDDLMIRQLETPRRPRALVFLDVRTSSYESAAAFEAAVSGAASVLTHLIKSDFHCDLWAGTAGLIDGSDYEAAMGHLAMVATHPSIDLRASTSRSRPGGGGTLFLVSGVADGQLLSVLRLLVTRYPSTALMTVAGDVPHSTEAFRRLGASTIHVCARRDWAA